MTIEPQKNKQINAPSAAHLTGTSFALVSKIGSSESQWIINKKWEYKWNVNN